MADVFVSYKKSDKARVAPLVKLLHDEGWTVFIDPNIETGENWVQVIQRELKAAKCVVVAWSPEAADSQWVQAEAHDGRDRKILAPCFVEKTPLPVPFNTIQTCDLSTWNGSRDHPEARALIATVRRHAGEPVSWRQGQGQGTTDEAAHWTRIAASRSARDFDGFLGLFPNGKYAGAASTRRSQLRLEEALGANRGAGRAWMVAGAVPIAGLLLWMVWPAGEGVEECKAKLADAANSWGTYQGAADIEELEQYRDKLACAPEAYKFREKANTAIARLREEADRRAAEQVQPAEAPLPPSTEVAPPASESLPLEQEPVLQPTEPVAPAQPEPARDFFAEPFAPPADTPAAPQAEAVPLPSCSQLLAQDECNARFDCSWSTNLLGLDGFSGCVEAFSAPPAN